jgi:TatA/E family protein of Tat protein translocase
MIGPKGDVRTMFGLGVPELIFILLLALLIFGPKRLPEIGRTLGKGMSEFRKASNELTRTLNAELALDETPAPPPVQMNRMDALRTPRTSLIAEVPPLEAEPSPAPAAEPPAGTIEGTPVSNTPVEPS